MKYLTILFAMLMIPIAFLILACKVAYDFLDEQLFESFTNEKESK